MAGNSWQQPVAGEPSLGTPHFHRWNSGIAVPAGTGQQTLSLVGQVPTGTKAVFCYMGVMSAGVSSAKWIQVEDAAGNRTAWSGRNQVANAMISGSGFAPVDGNLNMFWRVGDVALTGIELVIVPYFI